MDEQDRQDKSVKRGKGSESYFQFDAAGGGGVFAFTGEAERRCRQGAFAQALLDLHKFEPPKKFPHFSNLEWQFNPGNFFQLVFYWTVHKTS